jgi:3-hexulose-6-phosphate synthase
VKIQVALDFVDKETALHIAEEVCDYADILEAGTPLIKACGAEIIRELKKLGKEVFADTKTIDAVEIEAELVKSKGADYFSILGVAPENTITKAKSITGIKKVLDLIGVKDKILAAKKYEGTFDHIVFHTGIDEGVFDPEKYTEIAGLNGLAVAGGINERNIDEVLNLKPEIIIIGRYITKNKDPKTAAKNIKEVIECL